MAKIITSTYLNKKLTGDLLKNKVGIIKINNGGEVKALAGVRLKKFITKFGGETAISIEKKLKNEYGISGYQRQKREDLMKIIKGDNKTGLPSERIKENIARVQRQRRSEESAGSGKGETFIKQYAGGRVVESHEVRGVMKDLGVGWGKAGDKIGGFASQYNIEPTPNNTTPKTPPAGSRPVGL